MIAKVQLNTRLVDLLDRPTLFPGQGPKTFLFVQFALKVIHKVGYTVFMVELKYMITGQVFDIANEGEISVEAFR